MCIAVFNYMPLLAERNPKLTRAINMVLLRSTSLRIKFIDFLRQSSSLKRKTFQAAGVYLV
jgi:hypothetical protein